MRKVCGRLATRDTIRQRLDKTNGWLIYLNFIRVITAGLVPASLSVSEPAAGHDRMMLNDPAKKRPEKGPPREPKEAPILGRGVTMGVGRITSAMRSLMSGIERNSDATPLLPSNVPQISWPSEIQPGRVPEPNRTAPSTDQGDDERAQSAGGPGGDDEEREEQKEARVSTTTP